MRTTQDKGASSLATRARRILLRLVRPDLWRFGLQLPLVLIMLVLTTPRLYLRWYQPAIQLAARLFGVGTLLMAVEGDTGAEAEPSTGPRMTRR